VILSCTCSYFSVLVAPMVPLSSVTLERREYNACGEIKKVVAVEVEVVGWWWCRTYQWDLRNHGGLWRVVGGA